MDDNWLKRIGIPVGFSEEELNKLVQDDFKEKKDKKLLKDHDKEMEENDYDFCEGLENNIISFDVKFNRTPPRTARHKKQKDAYCVYAKEAAQKLSRRNSHPELFYSLLDHDGAKFRLQERLKFRQRNVEREYKKKICHVTSEETHFSSCPIPAASEKGTCYKSVSCRAFACHPLKIMFDVVQKISTPEIPKERITFYSSLHDLLKQSPADATFNQTEVNEEVEAYKHELAEVLWLELQAWHANEDCHIFDAKLLEKRKIVHLVIDKVLYFKFERNLSLHSKLSAEFTSCSGCLSIWCQQCTDEQNEALRKVEQLLNEIREAELLFPSTKNLIMHFPEWNSIVFQGKYHAIQIWYYAVTQLRCKIILLGRRLGHMTDAKIPWPFISCDYSTSVNGNVVQRYNRLDESTVSDIIQVEICDADSEDAVSTSDSGVHSSLSDAVESKISDLKNTVEHSLQDTAEPSKSLPRCMSSIFAHANPYRKYVEKLLRIKGLTKTIAKVDEIVNNLMEKLLCILECSSEESVKLLAEFKESIKLVVQIKKKYTRYCHAVLLDLDGHLQSELEDRHMTNIVELDEKVKLILMAYFDCLNGLVLMLHKETQISTIQRNFLEHEWKFVHMYCANIDVGNNIAVTTFCNIACEMLSSAKVFIDGELDLSSVEDNVNQQTISKSDHSFSEEDIEDSEKRAVILRCRLLQEHLTEAKERLLQIIGFAKMLRRELELVIEFTVKKSLIEVFDRLKKTGHVYLLSTKWITIFASESMQNMPDYCWKMLEMDLFVADDDSAVENKANESHYLVILNCCESSHPSSKKMCDELTFERKRKLNALKTSGLMLVVARSSHLPKAKEKLLDLLGDLLDSTYIEKALSEEVTESLDSLKMNALELCSDFGRSINKFEKLINYSHDVHAQTVEEMTLRITRDTIHQAFLVGFKYHREVARLIKGKLRPHLSSHLATFAQQWIRFVSNYYSSGKGTYPKWAMEGLNFLLFACEPQNTRHMKHHSFKVLKSEVEKCFHYIIGKESPRMDFPSRVWSPSTTSFFGYPISSAVTALSENKNKDSFDSQLKVNEEGEGSALNPESRIEIIRKSVTELDSYLDAKRRQEKLIGFVTDVTKNSFTFKTKSVVFSWIRGFKIGAGTYGKVYSAVNTDTGQAMAVKEMRISHIDRQSTSKMAEELDILRGINHTNLVKHYGVEMNEDQVRIFMEYCPEGTLYNLSSSTETGLPEIILRKYTRQLLEAVNTLHENRIIHRDIKAYMAPEVFTSRDGYGRAADVWSIGCVVIEMATGKRPWPEYKELQQIMFIVGGGERPPAPSSLSSEGVDFLDHCLQHDPNLRYTTAQLLDHSFVKVLTYFGNLHLHQKTYLTGNCLCCLVSISPYVIWMSQSLDRFPDGVKSQKCISTNNKATTHLQEVCYCHQ